MQSDIIDVLLRFRKNPVALVRDISEMYLQFEIAAKELRSFLQVSVPQLGDRSTT